jgi:hypothetical protein
LDTIEIDGVLFVCECHDDLSLDRHVARRRPKFDSRAVRGWGRWAFSMYRSACRTVSAKLNERVAGRLQGPESRSAPKHLEVALSSRFGHMSCGPRPRLDAGIPGVFAGRERTLPTSAWGGDRTVREWLDQAFNSRAWSRVRAPGRWRRAFGPRTCCDLLLFLAPTRCGDSAVRGHDHASIE